MIAQATGIPISHLSHFFQIINIVLAPFNDVFAFILPCCAFIHLSIHSFILSLYLQVL